MASRRAAIPAKHLFNGFKTSQSLPLRTATRNLTTTTTTEPSATLSQTHADAHLTSTPTDPILHDNISQLKTQTTTPLRPHLTPQPANPFLTTATCTLHAFPTLEPVAFTSYPSTHLLLPLRRDLLHRAIIYEGDMTRQGTASTKWRSEVHGSNRKIRPQKGTGAARLGNKKSPMLKGGGQAFGPKPRDFSTELPRKVYDLAFRTALSWRWRTGGLVVVEGELGLGGEAAVGDFARERFVREVLGWFGLGKEGGRSLFVGAERREALFGVLEAGRFGARGLAVADVDVKDLLEGGRVVVEREALEWLLREHEGDLRDRERLVHFRKGKGVVANEVQMLRGRRFDVV